jgi:hypothetical protein
MKTQLLTGVAAALALSAPAFAQSAGDATPGAPAASTPAAPVPAAPSTTTGVVGITPPGVAGGVQPYQPAGAPSANGLLGNGAPAPLSTPLGPTPPPSGSFVTNSINSTLQAGQIPGSDSATVGAASTGTGLRMPNPATGIYNGAAGPTYGLPGATPYTGPAGSASGATGAAAIPPGATPYTGPASPPGAAPASGASGR